EDELEKARCSRDKCTDHPRSSIPEDWVVETEGTKLPTPHPVIEPVSGTRARNGNFRCRDGSAKAAVPPLRDRYRDAQRLEKPPFWRDYREKTERSSIPMTGWGRRKG